MSRNLLVTFGGNGYDHVTERVMSAALRVGVDEVRVYDDVWLEGHPFRHMPGNRWLWETEERRGMGWHAFKPLIVLDAMDRFAEDLYTVAGGDVILYLDGDTFPTGKDLRPLFDRARQEQIVLFDYVGHEPQSTWCTRNCFVAMGQDEPRYHEALHGCARFGLFLVGSWMARQFLYEWLAYCVNPDANGRHPRPSLGPNLPGFKEHRTDQAIYTNLAHKYGLHLYPEPSEPGEGYFIQEIGRAHV